MQPATKVKDLSGDFAMITAAASKKALHGAKLLDQISNSSQIDWKTLGFAAGSTLNHIRDLVQVAA
jgi:hypothetical protein